ncbi:MAG: hypothetical protein HYU39_02280 [Thaumarchaeota archaeon]|nr:hypothetical protein [Nitrososphaerota archaeon]
MIKPEGRNNDSHSLADKITPKRFNQLIKKLSSDCIELWEKYYPPLKDDTGAPVPTKLSARIQGEIGEDAVYEYALLPFHKASSIVRNDCTIRRAKGGADFYVNIGGKMVLVEVKNLNPDSYITPAWAESHIISRFEISRNLPDVAERIVIIIGANNTRWYPVEKALLKHSIKLLHLPCLPSINDTNEERKRIIQSFRERYYVIVAHLLHNHVYFTSSTKVIDDVLRVSNISLRPCDKGLPTGRGPPDAFLPFGSDVAAQRKLLEGYMQMPQMHVRVTSGFFDAYLRASMHSFGWSDGGLASLYGSLIRKTSMRGAFPNYPTAPTVPTRCITLAGV